jgi:serine phosphatase RsbU (regulator of sigma subunit)
MRGVADGNLDDDGSTAIIVADVSGHGAEAGLVALRFKKRITAGHPSALLVATATITDLDMLLICTDGVLEARDSQGAQFGSEGVRRGLRGLRRWSPEEAVAECSEAVRQLAVDLRRDDVTCVASRLAWALGAA